MAYLCSDLDFNNLDLKNPNVFILPEEEKRLLPRLNSIFQAYDCVDQLFNILLKNKKTQHIFKKAILDKQKIQKLRLKLKNYLSFLLTNPFTEEFQECAQQVGQIHSQKAVNFNLFIEATAILHRLMVYYINKEEKNDNVKHSLQKVFVNLLLYNTSLIVKAYINSCHLELEKLLKESQGLNRIYNLLREINLLIFEERYSVKKLFQESTRILHREGGFSLVWIGIEEASEKPLKIIAATGHTQYLEKFTIVSREKIKKEGLKNELKLLSQGFPVIINDIATDIRFSQRRQQALEFGFRALIILPLFLDQDVRGFLFLYHKEPQSFTENEVKLLQEIARDLSLGWMHIEKTKKLEKILFFDELTGLGNERYFMESLEHEIITSKRRNNILALIRLDLDDFSLVNHSFGYAAGDKVLKELAVRFKNLDSAITTLAHTGPDDFSFSFNIKDEKELQDIILKLQKILDEPIIYKGKTIKISACMGIAFYPRDAKTATSLFEAATVALKKAQKSGHNGFSFYAEEDTINILRRFRYLEELEKALINNEFVLYYQPRINLFDRTIAGFEALIRWRHPARGTINPSEFIPILEESNLIISVGNWVIRAAAKFLKHLQKFRKDLALSFNVSVKQFQDPEFLTILEDVIKKEEFPPEKFQIEITEGVFLEAGHKINEIFKVIKRLGIKIAIDDFGTGFSSMLYLKRIPACTLKIDQYFVKEIPDDRENVEIVKAISDLAKNLGKKTVAEGVETREQLAFLTGLGVDEVQGFYFSAPMSEKKTIEFLNSYKPENFFWHKEIKSIHNTKHLLALP